MRREATTTLLDEAEAHYNIGPADDAWVVFNRGNVDNRTCLPAHDNYDIFPPW